jgi:hypothetical protein
MAEFTDYHRPTRKKVATTAFVLNEAAAAAMLAALDARNPL